MVCDDCYRRLQWRWRFLGALDLFVRNIYLKHFYKNGRKLKATEDKRELKREVGRRRKADGIGTLSILIPDVKALWRVILIRELIL